MLEPDETSVGGLQLPGKDRVVFRAPERKSLLGQYTNLFAFFGIFVVRAI